MLGDLYFETWDLGFGAYMKNKEWRGQVKRLRKYLNASVKTSRKSSIDTCPLVV